MLTGSDIEADVGGFVVSDAYTGLLKLCTAGQYV